MLLDKRHKPWLLGTAAAGVAAVAVYAALAATAPDHLTGGSTVGLWYGVCGAALMAVAGLLAAVRRLPVGWPVGSRPGWLRAHLWLSPLACVFVLCHSGFRLGGLLERLLWLAVVGVCATGVLGLVLQQVLPRLLTARVPCEAPPGHFSHACRVLRRRADAVVDRSCGPHDARGPDGPAGRKAADAGQHLRAFYEGEVRPVLGRRIPRRVALANSGEAAVLFARLRGMSALAVLWPQFDELAALCQERRLLAEQERLHFWLHAWLYLHVPLAAALGVLAAAHVISALYY